ncbi:beta-galactosidase GalB [Paludisphaera mucosa]|uniref:Beta-galactosidase GalB n=1 Tax=Paludisphaera mucosa TaxID=3030827 RepID=A0ABT6F9Q7_9BACT|nr:beta-galactosidase GalB [Paludisphaera mucosa]MDG3004211.1 beta-galactosidase GalB [Paludisphaera mucosa]
MSVRSSGACGVALLIAAWGLAPFAAAAGPPRSRESFNAGWKFARFGPMPDGSRLPEPGAPRWKIPARASSEETGKNNTADAALDGDPKTRWCAASGRKDEWLAIDLGPSPKVAALAIDWEFPDLRYAYAVEASDDGQAWEVVRSVEADHPVEKIAINPGRRLVRIRVAAPPAGKWASVAEVRLFDAAAKPVVNERVDQGETPAATGFDDAGWWTLDVPHDWGIEGPFRDDLPNDTGKLPWKGIGWYRKAFAVPAADRGRRVFIDFDGAMANSQVWLNGRLVGGWPFGYQAFRLELTPYLKYDAENVLAVRLDAEKWGSRWYPGAGIYRNVWLVKSSPLHVAHWGVFATIPALNDDAGTVSLAVTVDNQLDVDALAVVRAVIYELDEHGAVSAEVAEAKAVERSILTGGQAQASLSAVVPKPRRWDLESPRRYVARVVVERSGEVVDVYDQPFGFRTIEFTGREGFKLNGKTVFLKGTCNHHDLGPLGAALNVRALERQLEILKEMGCNALRTSHNPPAPELLDLADRMGFVVMVEAFDCWKTGKTAGDYSALFDEWHARDLEAMVRRERNHPSVVMWSIGNEVAEQDGPELAKALADVVRSYDATRPVTAGCNNPEAGVNGFQTAVDAFGLNYHTDDYARILEHPGNANKPIYTSESSSCVSSRGEYFFPVKRGRDSQANFQISSYDVDAPPWAQPPDEVFAALDRNPRFFGEFVWTGFDYLGEPTPYNSDATNLLNFSDPAKREAMKAELARLGSLKVPSASSYFGILDLCGFKKDRFYIYQARWRPDLAMAHILPHWNWPERQGLVTPVHVYTSGDEAELFLDGVSLGRKKKAEFEYRLRWDDVTYRPGVLKVVAYKAGREWATDVVATTGPATKLALAADRAEIAADGRDLSFVTVTVADAEGRLVPRSANLVTFAIDGPGEIVAVGNGDAASHEPFQATRREAFNGLVQAIVRIKPGQAGPVILRAESEGLDAAQVVIKGR